MCQARAETTLNLPLGQGPNAVSVRAFDDSSALTLLAPKESGACRIVASSLGAVVGLWPSLADWPVAVESVTPRSGK